MKASGGNAELQGSIPQFSLADVVQFLGVSAKSGKLELEDPGRGVSGAIYVEGGTVVHAAVEGREGEEAFYELVGWQNGRFSFLPDESAPRATVQRSSANLLMEGVRRSDEWRILSQHIPDLGWIPEFVPPDASQTGQQITLNTSEWMVLSKIDGRRSVSEVARAADLSEFQTCRLLYPLLSNHLLRLREPSP